ncbi:FMN-binding negative transcriptional regulator [Granulicoccus sp. GXG6511]|uniref:FMN-binding negative transcriptional regulator n=1 Tax=Granulicoccus sp. GXG6511 TaxID=3381351 RepID=UPI003D7CF9C8
MWIPERFAMSRDETLELLNGIAAADLITPHGDGVEITYLPWTFDASVGEQGSLRAHLARQNPHADALAAGHAESVVVVHGVDCYVSPKWYVGGGVHQVPTWDYVVAHVHGHVTVHTDPDWLLAHVREQAEKFEAGFAEPWTIEDAPADFVAGMCRAIVGVELTITRIEAKAKLSQNKSPEIVSGIVAGLRGLGDHAAADAVERANRGKQWPPLRTRYRTD